MDATPRPQAPATARDPGRYCSGYSLAAGEPLAGTGSHNARLVLLRWPRRRWRHSPRQAGGMDADLVAAVEAVAAAGFRVNLIDRRGAREDAVRLYLLPEALAFDLAPGAVTGVLRAIAGGGDFSSFAPRPMGRSLVLCCTHGRHDRCCAKFGFAAYQALAAAAARDWPERFSVWETTHLGGCRFSASALVLPAMRKYGRIAPRDAAPLLAAEAEGRVHLPCYRGNARLGAAEQVAEAAVLATLDGPPQGLAVLSSVEEGPEAIVEMAVGAARYRVICAADTLASHGACSDLDAGQAPETRRVWRVRGILRSG
jgi:hypothetical protein